MAISATLFDDLRGHGTIALIGLVCGSAVTWLAGRWKRYQQRQSILRGEAFDTVVIQHHVVETAQLPAGERGGTRTAPSVMRVRALGQGELNHVVPNEHLSSELLNRAMRVTARDTLISMDGPAGSYLLETLTNFVCDHVGNAPFEHDLYVMAPCCEPAGMADHQPIAILLIAVADLALFEEWTTCRAVRVERGSDGVRILTLMELARRFKAEQTKIAELRAAGKRTRFVETMYVLDLALDRRAAGIAVKSVPWGRFEGVLKEMDLE